MDYDIPDLLERHRQCLDEIATEFARYFTAIDYSAANMRKVRKHLDLTKADLEDVLYGPGFYLIATDVETGKNDCRLTIAGNLRVVYRGHSSNVRERIESHLFYDSYRNKDAGRRFTVCMKLDGANINIDRAPLDGNRWAVVTHSMPGSTLLIREAAEAGFDEVFGKPVGSDR